MKSIKPFLLVGILASNFAGAQNFAVLLAKDDPGSPVGYPTNWPVQVQPIGSLTNLPPRYPPPWRLVTQAQVDRWKADHTAEMTAYQAAQEAAATQPKRDRETVIRTILGRLKTLKSSTGPLTDDQRDKALREIAAIIEALIEDLRP